MPSCAMTSPASRRGGIAVGLLAALLLTACASGPDPLRTLSDETRLLHAALIDLGRATDGLRRELSDLRGRVGSLQSAAEKTASDAAARHAELAGALAALGDRVGAAERRLAEVEGLVTATQHRLAGVEARGTRWAAHMESLATTVKGIETTVGGLADQVARLESLPAPAPIEVKPSKPAARAPAAGVVADELFGRAMEALRKGELGQAILDFEGFLVKHPSHPWAGHAQFWIGEAYFTARDYQHAAVEYQKALDRAPRGDKTPEALLKLGLAYRALKRLDRARDAWAQLLRDFPESEAAQKARSALRKDTATPR